MFSAAGAAEQLADRGRRMDRAAAAPGHGGAVRSSSQNAPLRRLPPQPLRRDRDPGHDGHHKGPDDLERLSPREREVLALIAEGRSNASLAAHLFISEAAVNKHIGDIFNKLDLPADTEGHRRVLAVLAFLRA